jgi:hypothetical protein
MTQSRHLRAAAILVVSGGMMIGLGSASGAAGSADRSTPTITGVQPATPAPQNEPQRLAVSGTDFMAGLTLEVTSPAGQTTTFKGDDIMSRRTDSFAVSLVLDVAGTYVLRVTNTDGGMSNPFELEVKKGESTKPNAPVISSITPSEPIHRTEAQTLRVEGQRFEEGLRAIVTNPIGQEVGDVAITHLTPTSFDLLVTLDRAGDFELVVSNPSGGASNVAKIPVR